MANKSNYFPRKKLPPQKLKALSGRGSLFVFAGFGSGFGFLEEIPGFSIVIVALFVLAGYDVMTGLAVLFIGATVGNMASVVNLFSVVADIEVNTRVNEEGHELSELTRKKFWSIMVLIGIIVLLILGYMPWYVVELDGGKILQGIPAWSFSIVTVAAYVGIVSSYNQQVSCRNYNAYTCGCDDGIFSRQ